MLVTGPASEASSMRTEVASQCPSPGSSIELHCHLQDFPEPRLQFFNLLRAITNNCFDTLYTLSALQLQLVINSIIWAFRHTERNIAETGEPVVVALGSLSVQRGHPAVRAS